MCLSLASLVWTHGAVAQDAALLDAARAGDLEEVRSAVVAGADIDAADENGATALMWAAYGGNIDAVRYLMAQGSDPARKGVIWLDDEKTTYYGNLTGIAAGEGRLDLLRLLIEDEKIPADDREWDPETQSESGWTALEWAEYTGNTDVFSYLVAALAASSSADTDAQAPRIESTLTSLFDATSTREAVDSAERLSADVERMLGRTAQTADLLARTAYLLYERAVFAAARPLYERALAIRMDLLGPDHPQVANTLNELGMLLFSQGDFRNARARYERALAILENVSGAHHPDVGVFLSNLGLLLQEQGDYASARPLYERSLKILEESLRTRHPQVAVTLTNLALLLRYQRNYEDARPLFERALSIDEAFYGLRHQSVATDLNNLATLHWEQGELTRARELYDRSLDIYEEVLGAEHPRVALSLNNIGFILNDQGDHAGASSHVKRALAIEENAYGPEHPEVARTLGVLAAVRAEMGDDAAALALSDRAIRILDATIAYPERRVAAYLHRARIHERQGETEKALADLDEALRSAEELRPNVGGGEDTRARYFSTYGDAFHQMVEWRIAAGEVRRAFEYAERGQARTLLDQLSAGKVDLRAAIPPEVREPLERREQDARARLAQFQQMITVAQGRRDLTGRDRLARIAALEDSLKAADRDYVDAYEAIKNASPLWRDLLTTGSEPVDLRTVQRRIVPDDGLLLRYVVGPESAFLFVVPPLGEDPHVLSLEIGAEAASLLDVDAGPVTDTILQTVLTGAPGDPERFGLIDDLATHGYGVQKRLHGLFLALVPEPVRERLGDAEEVVLIPDAGLHHLPFEALVVDTVDRAPRYWLDAGPPVRYAPSATVLYNLTQRPNARMVPRAGTPSVLSVSDPIYNPGDVLASLEGEAGGSGELADAPDAYVRAAPLARLPGTVKESEAIRQSYGGSADVVQLLQRADADEPTIRSALPGKRYVHLATHGVVNEKRGALFSALALTPPSGEAVASENDGLLQLHEIYELQLDDLEMAVLSACETNVGERIDGEGVFALSRGFLAAGARRVIASQWQVDDASTAELMGALFERIVEAEHSGRTVEFAGALHEAQQTIRSRPGWEHPYFWAPFVLIGKQ